MHLMPLGYWAKKRNTFKKNIGNLDEKQLNDEEELCDLTEISKNTHAEINLSKEINK